MKIQAPRVCAESVRRVLEEISRNEVHARRVLPLANATLGVIQAGALSVHAFGCALADAEALDAKHAIKQVDRLVGNEGVDIDALFADWVPFVVEPPEEIVVAIDWTDFDADGHSSLVLSSVSSHGRATPLF